MPQRYHSEKQYLKHGRKLRNVWISSSDALDLWRSTTALTRRARSWWHPQHMMARLLLGAWLLVAAAQRSPPPPPSRASDVPSWDPAPVTVTVHQGAGCTGRTTGTFEFVEGQCADMGASWFASVGDPTPAFPMQYGVRRMGHCLCGDQIFEYPDQTLFGQSSRTCRSELQTAGVPWACSADAQNPEREHFGGRHSSPGGMEDMCCRGAPPPPPQGGVASGAVTRPGFYQWALCWVSGQDQINKSPNLCSAGLYDERVRYDYARWYCHRDPNQPHKVCTRRFCCCRPRAAQSQPSSLASVAACTRPRTSATTGSA